MRSLLRLWPYVRPVRARWASAAVVAIVASCLSLVIPLVLKWMVDGPIAGRDPGGVWLGAAALFVLGVVEALLFGFRRWLVARPLAGVEAGLRADLYRHVQRLPVAFHDKWASGQLLSRGTTDLMLIRMFLAFPLTFLIVNGTTILVGFVILLMQQWTLGLVLMVPVIPLMILCAVFEGKYALVSRRAQDQVGDLTTVVEESVLGIRIIKGFGRHRAQSEAFRELSQRLRGTELAKARLLAGILGLITVIPELAIGAALVLGTIQVADGGLSAGTLVAFLSTALALRWPVESIGFLLAMSQEAATAADRFFEVMDAPEERDPEGAGPEERDPEGAGPKERDPEGAGPKGKGPEGLAKDPAAGGEAGGLRFEGVEFRYPDAPADSVPLLEHIDLHIRPGETLALVGATGSGKTTLTALVPRLHERTGGRITLDGRDIDTMPRAELRELVSVAFEEPTLFSATVGENVLMGAGPDAGDEELRRALDIAQADFVHRLPEGADTEVGEQGLSLSGGQRQRLALARAVVGRPRFLVLDDPLSALDVHTEALVEAALRRVLADTTALVVAHRPSTVMLADRVALLSGGRIAAVGTHHELLRDNAEYAWLMSGAQEDRTREGGAREEGAREESARPEGARPLEGAAEAGVPRAGAPEPGTAEPGAPRAGAPEPGTAEPGTPRAGAPEPGAREPGAPPAGAPEPGATEMTKAGKDLHEGADA
ncbi:ABC transporter transmembrane domain-containing protein [Streptomyces sp. NPDC058657]|uniref:ABC transporter transmembrane domain-containing protein n=1 Tax=Streptomyces sp. NPDC058657 TaxID=3346579 RepID=UPI003665A487